MCAVIFYDIPRTGEEPAREFLESLDERTRGRFLQTIGLLAEKGRLPRPYAAHLEGKIWELRVIVAGERQRILYAIITGRKIVLLLGFTKTTAKVPRTQIKQANEYLEEYQKRKQKKP